MILMNDDDGSGLEFEECSICKYLRYQAVLGGFEVEFEGDANLGIRLQDATRCQWHNNALQLKQKYCAARYNSKWIAVYIHIMNVHISPFQAFSSTTKSSICFKV